MAESPMVGIIEEFYCIFVQLKKKIISIYFLVIEFFNFLTNVVSMIEILNGTF